jgi:hypothetical protein
MTRRKKMKQFTLNDLRGAVEGAGGTVEVVGASRGRYAVSICTPGQIGPLVTGLSRDVDEAADQAAVALVRKLGAARLLVDWADALPDAVTAEREARDA